MRIEIGTRKNKEEHKHGGIERCENRGRIEKEGKRNKKKKKRGGEIRRRKRIRKKK